MDDILSTIVFLDAATVGEDLDLTEIKNLGNYKEYPITIPDEVVSRSAIAEIIITNKVVLNKEILYSLPKLKLICVAATGINNIDLETAKNLGIEVNNVVNYSTQSVAQHTFALLLGLINQISYHDHYVKSGLYSANAHFTHLARPYYELAGKRIGILGMGNIGRKVAQIAKSFGMEVVFSSLSGISRKEDFSELPLNELIQTSDVISIHSPLNTTTKGLVNGEFIRKMKKTAIVINVGRGGIVIEQDLAEAINHELIAGACIDVFEQEPVKSDNPLLTINQPQRVILSPHIAWASKEARKNLVNQLSQHIKKYLESK